MESDATFVKRFHRDVPPPVLASGYVLEVRKYFARRRQVLQAAADTRTVLAGVAITCLSVVLRVWENKRGGISNDTNNSHIPVSAAAMSCHSQEVHWFHSRRDKRPFHACSAAPKISTHQASKHENRTIKELKTKALSVF